MSNIRETYSGLISFATSLITLVTGLAYMLIITRSLSIHEYGIWGIINSLLVYGLIFSAIPAFWLVRETAREIHSEKTGVISSVIWSFLGLSVYFISVFTFAEQTNIDKHILIFAGILIPVNILQKIVSAINLGWKPQITSYGILAAQIVLIPLTIFFVTQLDLGLIGVILSLFISILINLSIQLYSLRKRFAGIFDLRRIKKWFKFSWVQLYPKISTVLYTSDVIIFSILIGTPEIIAYYFAANVLANIVTNSASITQAIYPKILSGYKGNSISRNITYLIFFTCPLISLAIVFAKPGITLLNPIYQEAYVLVVFLSFKLFFNVLTEIFEQFIIGNEKIDIKKESTFIDYIKSKLIIIPTLRIIQNATYLVIFTMIIFYSINNKTNQELLILWVVISMLSQIPLLIFLSLKIRKIFLIKFEIKNMVKYAVSGFAAFGFISIFIKDMDMAQSFFDLLHQIIFLTVIGIGLYILISLIIDKPIRNLLKGIILEIRGKI